MDAAPAPPTFAEVLDGLAGVEGWLSDAQAARLWDLAVACPPGGTIVEIGSFHGRSTILWASAADPSVRVVAIDPHGGNDTRPQVYDGDATEGERDHRRFVANLEAAGVRGRVDHVRRPSQEATGAVTAPVDVLYVDGAHRYRPAVADLRLWGDKVAPGGWMAVHDSFGSIGVTMALAATTFGDGRFRYEGRVGTLAVFRREDLVGAARRRNLLAQARELGFLARNVAIKLLILARLGRVTPLLGGNGEWPY